MKRILCSFLIISVLAPNVFAKDLHFMGQDYPPLNWQDGSKVTGAMVDVMQSACDKLKHNCKFSIVPLARANKMLEDGEVDGGLSLIATPEREAYLVFTPTIIVSRLAYLGQKGKGAKLGSVEDLSGWTVGVVRGSSSSKIAMKHKEQVKTISLQEDTDNEAMVKKFMNGRFGEKSALFGSEDVLKFFAKKNQLELEPLLVLDGQSFKTAFSKKKADIEVVEAFRKTIDEMKKSGELKKILEKYSLKSE